MLEKSEHSMNDTIYTNMRVRSKEHREFPAGHKIVYKVPPLQCQHSHMRLRELCKDAGVGGNTGSKFERQG